MLITCAVAYPSPCGSARVRLQPRPQITMHEVQQPQQLLMHTAEFEFDPSKSCHLLPVVTATNCTAVSDLCVDMASGQGTNNRMGWREVQRELLHLVCQYLNREAHWAMRHVSPHWRESIDQLVGQKLVLKTTAQNLGSKIATLHDWRQSGKLRCCSLDFTLPVPVFLKDLARLLEDLTNQLDSITSCRAGFTLLVAQDSNFAELMQSAEHVALSAHLLQEHQLTVGISIQPATNTTIVPPALVLQQLGAFLCQFDTYTIPTDQPAATTNVGVRSAVTVNHIVGLRDSDTSDCTLYIATANPPPIQYAVPTMVASMANLTRLHLTIADRRCISTVDFQPSTQLSLLEDLALQVVPCKKPECCHGVVSTNRHSLHFVTLTAASWTVATYCSLQQIVQLKTLNISITNADTAQAQALGGITAELFKLTLHRHHHGPKSDETFQALQDSQPEVHELILRKQGDCDTCRPPLLPLLRRFTLRECSCLTGKSLPSYPRVTQLALIDCPVVTGDGLQHIIRTALPALQVISLHVSAQNDQAMHMSLCALNALHFGQNLHHIDLRGVSGLTLDRVIKFDYTMHRKQRQYKAQPCVTLLMPSQPLDKPEPVFDTLPTILLPNLYQLPNPGTFELQITY